MTNFDTWRKEDRQRAQDAIRDLMARMRRAARKERIPEKQIGELLGKISSLAPDPDALRPHDKP